MLASLGWCRPESFSSRGETDMFQYSALDVPSVDGSDADKTARLYSYTDADAVGVPLKTRPRSEHSLASRRYIKFGPGWVERWSSAADTRLGLVIRKRLQLLASSPWAAT